MFPNTNTHVLCDYKHALPMTNGALFVHLVRRVRVICVWIITDINCSIWRTLPHRIRKKQNKLLIKLNVSLYQGSNWNYKLFY